MRDALKLADEATITARMNAIPHSNYRAVVFTKEQYARTPLRDDTVDEHAQDMLYDFVAAGRVASAMDSDSHRKEAARRRVLSEYSGYRYRKAEKYPYFEDMGFECGSLTKVTTTAIAIKWSRSVTTGLSAHQRGGAIGAGYGN